MPEISVLPPEVINRIAAGEVVERPASLVKELIENSLDAGATEVEIDLEEGGRARVTVRDNGHGMDPEDLVLAFVSHATSKLRLEDVSEGLFGIATLGFRGEALASIGAVADVEIISRTPRGEHAWRFRPGKEAEATPAAGEPGTVIEIRELFAAVPARRKFLRSAPAELSRVIEQVKRLALGFPGVRFRLTQKQKTHLDLPRVKTLRERVAALIGEEKASQLLEVAEGVPGEGPALRGLVASPRLRRNDSREQHFFVNGRWVKDRTLTHALRSAYQGFLIPGYQPLAWIFLDFPTDAVDVNVHPTKAEVRFRDAGSIYPLVYHAVKGALEGSAGGPAERERELSPEARASLEESRRPPDRPTQGDLFRQQARSETRRELESFEPSGARPVPIARPQSQPRSEEGEPPPWASPQEASLELPSPPAEPEIPRDPALRGRALQLLDTFLVVDDGEGLVLVDQHALHEKILFEEILERLEAGAMVEQPLLVPEVVELSLESMPHFEEARVLLEACGYRIELFGEREVAVQSLPRIFERVRSSRQASEFVEEAFRWVASEERSVGDSAEEARELLRGPFRRLASIMACKRAVKAGDPLKPEEIQSLLDRADLARDPRHCPHGRPTTVRLERAEIDSLFDRK